MESSLEIDLSRVQTPSDIHAVFSAALGFPDWYGNNWDAFWDLVSSGYPLPDRLTIRGLDHVEKDLPRDAEKMLGCLADYNNSGRICKAAVTDDYRARIFYLRYEARPTYRAARQDVKGAFVSCWIKAESARDAHEIAVTKIRDYGWHVDAHQEMCPVSFDDVPDEGRPFFEQACIDGSVFNFNTWSSDD